MHDKHNDLINAVCDGFDFAKVHSVMTFLNWKWRTDSVPTEFEIRQDVRKQFKLAISRPSTKDHSTEGTGGFFYHIFREDGKVYGAQLDFVLTSSEYDVDDLEKED